jgi:hypothetical protein
MQFKAKERIIFIVFEALYGNFRGGFTVGMRKSLPALISAFYPFERKQIHQLLTAINLIYYFSFLISS